MGKRSITPTAGLHPAPVLLVSCGTIQKPNIITIAWAGTLASDPPLLSISIRPSRHSYGIIKESREFVVNVVTRDQVEIADSLGLVSGRDVDKFKMANLTPIPADVVKAPLIAECPMNLECVVRDTFKAGSHEVFIGEVVAAHADEEILDENGHLDAVLVHPLVYFCHNYFDVGAHFGQFGYTNRKKR